MQPSLPLSLQFAHTWKIGKKCSCNLLKKFRWWNWNQHKCVQNNGFIYELLNLDSWVLEDLQWPVQNTLDEEEKPFNSIELSLDL
jgi:hypothetical protein